MRIKYYRKCQITSKYSYVLKDIYLTQCAAVNKIPGDIREAPAQNSNLVSSPTTLFFRMAHICGHSPNLVSKLFTSSWVQFAERFFVPQTLCFPQRLFVSDLFIFDLTEIVSSFSLSCWGRASELNKLLQRTVQKINTKLDWVVFISICYPSAQPNYFTVFFAQLVYIYLTKLIVKVLLTHYNINIIRIRWRYRALTYGLLTY